MSRGDAAALDRLPWLPDEPLSGGAKAVGNAIGAWTAAMIVVVAAGAFWMGLRTVQSRSEPPDLKPASTTVRLPAPRAASPREQDVASRLEVVPPAPEVRSAPVRGIPIEAAPVQRPGQAKSVLGTRAAPARPKSNPIAVADARFVQGGAFGSAQQARHGWEYMLRTYPAVRGLPMTVRTSRNSKGTIFYRFQIVTTSQAHSEVLCQRFQRIDFSCTVGGMPAKEKVRP
jgi:hypothetical protein